jgi:hypothetical protein
MVPSLEKFRRDQQELEAERQRAKVELAGREAEVRKERQPDWSAFWETLDQRIAAIHARDIFTETQRDVLVTTVNDACDAMRGEISKAIEEARRTVDARFETLERRVRAPSALPPVKVWRQGMVTYEGELASFSGQLYQAKMDTGLQPGDPEAWTCVARAGRDAAQVTPRGEWSASLSYGSLNLVTYRDCSYVSIRDYPARPGDAESGWQMVAAKGAKGEPGPRGPRGGRGDRGAAEAPVTICGWTVNVDEYKAIPTLSNGQVGAILDLRPLFAQFGHETGTA